MSEEADLDWLSSDPEWVRKHADPDDLAGQYIMEEIQPPPITKAAVLTPEMIEAAVSKVHEGGPIPEYPEVNSGPLCNAEASGYLDSTDVYCPFSRDGQCTSMPKCPTNRWRYCLTED